MRWGKRPTLPEASFVLGPDLYGVLPIYAPRSTQQLRSNTGVGGPVLGIAWVGGFEGDL